MGDFVGDLVGDFVGDLAGDLAKVYCPYNAQLANGSYGSREGPSLRRAVDEFVVIVLLWL